MSEYTKFVAVSAAMRARSLSTLADAYVRNRLATVKTLSANAHEIMAIAAYARRIVDGCRPEVLETVAHCREALARELRADAFYTPRAMKIVRAMARLDAIVKRLDAGDVTSERVPTWPSTRAKDYP